MGHFKAIATNMAEVGVDYKRVVRPRQVEGMYEYAVKRSAVCSRCGSSGHEVMYAAGPYDPLVCRGCR